MGKVMGKMSHSALLLGSAATICLSTAALAADDDEFLEEIIVTSRRTSESLQDVPASVSVLTASTLQAANVRDMSDIIALTPGVTIVTSTAEVGDTQINIRGMNGARDAESNVALVVDGILKTNTAQLNQIQGELTQVEVLKGPQGAYYGRNAAAGAIVIKTQEPGEEMAIRGKVGFGENSTWNGRLVVSGPVSENTGFVLFGDWRKTDGFFRNTGPTASSQGATVDRYEGFNFGGRLMSNPSDRLKIDAKVRYGSVNAAGLTFDVGFNLPTFQSVLGVPEFHEDVNEHNFAFIGNITPDNDQETYEASIKADYDFDSFTLTTWALYSDVTQDFAADSTAASFYRFELQPSCRASVTEVLGAGFALPPPQVLFAAPFTSIYGPFGPTTCDGTQYQFRSQEDISLEMRLASKGDSSMQWSVGAYYMHMNRRNSVAIAEDTGQGVTRNQYNAPGSSNPTSLLFDDKFKTNVFAAFGSADYDLSDVLALSVAARYDREERDVESLVPNEIDPVTGAPINPGLPATGMIPDKSRAYQQFQPKISLTYKPSDNLTFYANWGVGFKAGGFNNQGSGAIVNDNFNIPLGAQLLVEDEFRKEKSSAFEVGIKGRALDGRLRMAAAIYHTNVTDMQFFEFYTGGFGLLRVVTNIDKVKLQGFEASGSLQVTEGVTLFGSANVTDSEIKLNNSRPDTLGNKSPYTADYTLNAGVDIIVPLSDSFDVSLRADWRRTGPTWFHTVQDQDVRTSFDLFFPGLGTANYGNAQRDAYDIVNLRASVQSGNWSVTGYVSNLFDKSWIAEVIPAPEFGGVFLSPGSQRTIGVEISASF